MLLLFLLITCLAIACTNQQQPPKVGEQEDGRTGEDKVKVAWKYELPRNTDQLRHAVFNKKGLVLCTFTNKPHSDTLLVLNPQSGELQQQTPIGATYNESTAFDFFLHSIDGEITLETSSGSFINPKLPQTPILNQCLPLADGFVLCGFRNVGGYGLPNPDSRFVSRVDAYGVELWSWNADDLGPELHFDGKGHLIDLGTARLLLSSRTYGLLIINTNTGDLVWEHPMTNGDLIMDIALGKDGIWLAKVDANWQLATILLLGQEGDILREVSFPGPVHDIGPLTGSSCWFTFGEKISREVYLLEPDQEPYQIVENIESVGIAEADTAPVFLNSIKGTLCFLQAGGWIKEYELPFYGDLGPKILSVKDGLVIIHYGDGIIAVIIDQP